MTARVRSAAGNTKPNRRWLQPKGALLLNARLKARGPQGTDFPTVMGVPAHGPVAGSSGILGLFPTQVHSGLQGRSARPPRRSAQRPRPEQSPCPLLPFTAMRDLAASQLPQPRLPSPPPPPLPARRPSSVAFVRQTGSVPRKEGSWAPISKAEPRAASPRALLVISNSVLFRSNSACLCVFVRSAGGVATLSSARRGHVCAALATPDQDAAGRHGRFRTRAPATTARARRLPPG